MATAQAEIITQPKVLKWTVDEYHKIADAGLFLNKRVELIEGEVLDRYQDPDPRLHLWTSEEYYRLAEAGLFDGKRVELIGGRIIEMSAQSMPHVKAVKRSVRALEKAFGEGWFAQNQAPLNLDDWDGASLPEPDVAIIAGEEDDYDDHPTEAALVLEVAYSTLRYDRNTKAGLYAKSGVADYWVLNLAERVLEVFRQPVSDVSAPFWHSYADQTTYKEGELIAPLAKPDAVISVANLLPPRPRKERK
ncbi:MAG: Uma2 family endonuclease [Blastocatellia bacterium]